MDVAKLIRASTGHDPSNLHSLAEENDRLRRLLAATARTLNSTKQELDKARSALGINTKPLTFLNFPREVRDQIYAYALRAPVNVQTEPRPMAYLHCGSLQWKPPTPGLCLTNKQIHVEANEVMYRQNVFHFSSPAELLRFEEQIGSWNIELVQRIEIMTSGIPAASMMEAELVAPCDYAAVPTHWVKAFNRSKLSRLGEMVIAGESDDSMDEWALMEMPECLRLAIIEVFGRNQTSLLPPKLVLKGFEIGTSQRFPAFWRVTSAAGYFQPDKTLHYD